MDLREAQTKYLTGEYKLKGEFAGSDYSREETLTRAERYAGWTLPSIFPDEPLMEYDEMQNDFQSVGAAATTNLANKMMMALFQPAKPFFRMDLTQEQRLELEGDAGLTKAEIDAALAQAEREAMKELNKIHARVVLNDAMLHLIITGNVLLEMPTKGNMQLFSLRDYCVKRDLHGNVTKIIMRSTKAVSALSNELASLAYAAGYAENDEASLYTGVCRVAEDRFMVWQEMEDLCYCHKRVGYYTSDTLPWIPLTWKLCRGKDYGTGLVEDYSGDFHTLSTTAEAMLDYTTVATDVKNLVNPTGMTDVRELTEAASGAYVHGREEDLFPYTAANQLGHSVQFLQERSDKIERRIGAAFLLNTSVTRDAERVTAEEIRMQAHELESSLGGIYSRLAVELQLPIAKRLLRKLVPVFQEVEPIIVAGFESLSRNSELDNLRAFFRDLAGIAELPDQVTARLKIGDVIALLGAGHGVEYSKFLKDEDQVKQEQSQAIQTNAQMAGAEAAAINQAQGST
jgi:hypothetical protein